MKKTNHVMAKIKKQQMMDNQAQNFINLAKIVSSFVIVSFSCKFLITIILLLFCFIALFILCLWITFNFF